MLSILAPKGRQAVGRGRTPVGVVTLPCKDVSLNCPRPYRAYSCLVLLHRALPCAIACRPFRAGLHGRTRRVTPTFSASLRLCENIPQVIAPQQSPIWALDIPCWILDIQSGFQTFRLGGTPSPYLYNLCAFASLREIFPKRTPLEHWIFRVGYWIFSRAFSPLSL